VQSIYLLNRKVDGDHGESFNQSVAVYARSREDAQALVRGEFARIRKASDSAERPYEELPEFSVDKIDLDKYKLLIHWITT
jgi:hypothetical protein